MSLCRAALALALASASLPWSVAGECKQGKAMWDTPYLGWWQNGPSEKAGGLCFWGPGVQDHQDRECKYAKLTTKEDKFFQQPAILKDCAARLLIDTTLNPLGASLSDNAEFHRLLREKPDASLWHNLTAKARAEKERTFTDGLKLAPQNMHFETWLGLDMAKSPAYGYHYSACPSAKATTTAPSSKLRGGKTTTTTTPPSTCVRHYTLKTAGKEDANWYKVMGCGKTEDGQPIDRYVRGQATCEPSLPQCTGQSTDGCIPAAVQHCLDQLSEHDADLKQRKCE